MIKRKINKAQTLMILDHLIMFQGVNNKIIMKNKKQKNSRSKKYRNKMLKKKNNRKKKKNSKKNPKKRNLMKRNRKIDSKKNKFWNKKINF